MCNVYPGTNNTALKSLFAQAFRDKEGSAHTPTTTGLDYGDINKGKDGACLASLSLFAGLKGDPLRLASLNYAARLIDYFDARLKTQAHWLDMTGRTPLEDDRSIAMERVPIKKEGLRWGKIPEKVRRQAVDKVVKAQLASGAKASESASNTTYRAF